MANDRLLNFVQEHDLRNSAFARENFESKFNTETMTMADFVSKGGSYMKERAAALEYIQIKCVESKLSPRLQYMAMTFFDRLHGQIPVVVEDAAENMILFLSCCITLTVKLEGRDILCLDKNVIPSQYTLVQAEEMESMISNRLEPVKPITPFDYVDYLCRLTVMACTDEAPHPIDIELLISKTQEDPFFTQIRPSVVAAASVLIYILKDSKNLKRAQNFERDVLRFVPLQDEIRGCQRKIESDNHAKEDGISCATYLVEKFSTCCNIQ